jgi:hypothetical protein
MDFKCVEFVEELIYGSGARRRCPLILEVRTMQSDPFFGQAGCCWQLQPQPPGALQIYGQTPAPRPGRCVPASPSDGHPGSARRLRPRHIDTAGTAVKQAIPDG